MQIRFYTILDSKLPELYGFSNYDLKFLNDNNINELILPLNYSDGKPT